MRRATEYDSMNSTRAIGMQSAKKAPNSCLNSGTLMKSKPGWTNPIKKRRDEKRKRDKRKEKKRRGKKLKGKERKERKQKQRRKRKKGDNIKMKKEKKEDKRRVERGDLL